VIALADLIERFAPQLLARYGDRLLPGHRQALGAMQRCRTRFAPRMLAQCKTCGQQRSVPHSCGHRSCPHCQHHESQRWLERQLQASVPASYFLVTFTLPAQLRNLAWSHQRQVYALLMQCAWATLATFCRNDAQLGASAGAVGVLHTHNRRLEFHPHVHMVMPAAALDTHRKLWRTKDHYLFNDKALAKVFRAKVLNAIEHAGLPLPKVFPDQWVVHCKGVGDGQKALLYLGRYLYRGVVQEKDILSYDDDGNVKFRYRDAKSGKMNRRTLHGADFLWLVLQHVLPKGLRRARNFGFLHPNSIRDGTRAGDLMRVLQLRAKVDAGAMAAASKRPAWQCTCGQPMTVLRRRLPATICNATHDAGCTRHLRPDKADTAGVYTMQ
jgi:hypothetical protein